MAVTTNRNAFVSPTSTTIGLSQMFSITAGLSDPAYLVLTALDRNEYTAKAGGAVGKLVGNGHTLSLSSIGGDGRGGGIVFAYQAATGRYYNSTYGYFDQLTYVSSGSLDDVTNLSLFGTSNLSQANAYAGNAYAMMQVASGGYLGSATVATLPSVTANVPAQATPNSIAAAAGTFVGQAWNMNGCWVLASAIAAEAGASLPVQSTAIGIAGQANGEWIVAFNGPAGQSGNWQSLVHTGEVVVIGTPGGGGHITTCVSGSGNTAMLVDNITYVNSQGKIANPANDGSSSDIIIAAPHAASQEWSGVQASSVVIYELDTPIVSTAVASDSLACLATQSLSSLFTASDPANRAITSWQVYDTATSDTLVIGTTSYSAHSAASAATTASLGSISLHAGSTATTDTLEVRAFNGSYWGDWQSLNVSVTAAKVTAPVVSQQTPNQTWAGGKAFSLTLPAATFTDPQHQTLKYSATLSNGQALPSWLSFNATTDTFSGTAPLTSQSVSIKVTATDTSGLTASETFAANVTASAVKPGIAVSAQSAPQTWTDGQNVDMVLPGNTFTDALGLKMTFAAYEVSGPNITSWLRFNPSTDEFTGKVPANASGTAWLAVVATDAQQMSAMDLFPVTFVAGSAHAGVGSTSVGAMPTVDTSRLATMLAFHGT